MENNWDFNKVIAIFQDYTEKVTDAVANDTIAHDKSDLQNDLYTTLRELNISFKNLQNNEYINTVSFGPEDKTFLTIKEIEKQIQKVLTGAVNKTVEQIGQEKQDYINLLDEDRKEKYRNLMRDPFFYVLLWWSYPGKDTENRGVQNVIDIKQLATDLIEDKKNREIKIEK